MHLRPPSPTTDAKHLWHPFSAAHDEEDFPPLKIERARGIKLYDQAGNAYFDTISSWWTNLHGHGHPRLVRAVTRQAKRLDHVNFSGFTHRPALELVERLQERLPTELGRFFFSDNGSTAVEAALKMAFQYFRNVERPEKKLFAYFDGAYHGDTLGCVGVSGVDDFHAPFSALKYPSLRLPSPCGVKASSITGDPTGLACSPEFWKRVETLLTEKANQIAAVIVEPLIFCVAGMRPYPAEVLQKLQVICRKLQILTIYDEVATAFGRTGTFFALDRSNTVPDFLCLAKGLSGGILPLALTVTTQSVYDGFRGDGWKTFLHGHSYTANPLACAAGVESLHLFKSQKTLDRMSDSVQALREEIELLARQNTVGDARYLGMIGAVDLVNPKTGKPFDSHLRAGRKVYLRSLSQGLVLRPLGDTIYWMLPLVTTEKQVRTIMKRSAETIQETIDALSQDPGADSDFFEPSKRDV